MVTTCEDLAWPPPEIRDRLESAARHAERVVVVTGANPGFVMDRFPLLAATASRRVTAVEVYRRVDTSVRRGPLVAKSGHGKSPVEFEAGVQSGAVGHRGLAASARLLAHGLGWPTHDVSESIEPVAADGTAIGLHQTASLETKDGRRILFDLTMAWEIDEPGDRVIVHGEPAVTFAIPGGYHGDAGTTAQGLVAIAHCRRLDSGFYLPTDLPLSVE